MLDIKLIRERPDEVKRSLATVGTPPEMIDAVLEADARGSAIGRPRAPSPSSCTR